MSRIHIACDHAGFDLKNELSAYLKEKGFEVCDHGAHSSERCDYPVYANAVCKAVLEEGGQGLLICGTGIGMSMAANRYAGIRAAVCACEFQAQAAREHNNANVLCLGARVTGSGLAVSIAGIFMSTAFAGGRHSARIDQFDAVTHPH
jgi:ribose 5-phosphate isomerase B